jgi:antitoxin ParD1/3/4
MKKPRGFDEDTSVRRVLRSLPGPVAKTLLAFFANNALMAMGRSIHRKPFRTPKMTTKNISLTEHYSELVDNLVASGRYKNASEVVREGLRLLEQRTNEDERRLELLQQLAAEGFRQLDQGEGVGLKTGSQVSDRISKLGRKAAKLAKSAKSG